MLACPKNINTFSSSFSEARSFIRFFEVKLLLDGRREDHQTDRHFTSARLLSILVGIRLASIHSGAATTAYMFSMYVEREEYGATAVAALDCNYKLKSVCSEPQSIKKLASPYKILLYYYRKNLKKK